MPDAVSGKRDNVSGYHRLVAGVKGQTIVMDGHTSGFVRPSKQVRELGQAFTIEAWIAVGAYPWNRAPIVAQENIVSKNSNLDEICWPNDISDNLPRELFN